MFRTIRRRALVAAVVKLEQLRHALLLAAGLKPVAGGESQGGAPAGGSTPPAGGSGGGQGGSGGPSGAPAGGSGGSGGEPSGGGGQGGSGGSGGSGGGSGGGGGNADAAATRLLKKAEQQLEAANRKIQELEDAGKSELDRERAKRERAERERDDAKRAVTINERKALVRSVAGELKLNGDLVADLAAGQLADLADDRDAAKVLVEGIRDRYQIPAVEGGGAPASFGTPASGGSGGGQGGGAARNGVTMDGASGDTKKDYRGGIGRGILQIARARGAVGPPNDEVE